MTRTSKQHIVQNKIECLEFGGSLWVGSQDAQMSWQTKTGSVISMYYFANNAPRKTHDNQLKKMHLTAGWTKKHWSIDTDTMNRLVIEHPRLHNEQIGFADKLDIKETTWPTQRTRRAKGKTLGTIEMIWNNIERLELTFRLNSFCQQNLMLLELSFNLIHAFAPWKVLVTNDPNCTKLFFGMEYVTRKHMNMVPHLLTWNMFWDGKYFDLRLSSTDHLFLGFHGGVGGA